MAKYYDRAWNPIFGCNGNFAGCEHCYAKELMIKRKSKWKNFNEVKLNKKQYFKKFSKDDSQLICVCTQSDLFQDEVYENTISGILRKCNLNKQNNYIFLTKYSQNLAYYFNKPNRLSNLNNNHINPFSFDNMIFGVTVCCNKDIHRIDDLKNINIIKHKFISFEPLLENINITDEMLNGIEWIIVGCETGNNHSICKLEWIENIVDKANKLNIPVFVNSIQLNDGKITSEFEEMPEKLRKGDIPYNV